MAAPKRRATVEAYRRNGRNVSAAARDLGVHRKTVQDQLHIAAEKGEIDLTELHPPNVQSEDYVSARAAKLRAFEARKRAGNWRKPVLLNLPAEPCVLILMGDPHLDNDGTNFELFEQVWRQMGPRVYGICVGDWFDNWRGALAHLHAESSIRPSDAWVLLEHLMSEHGEHLIAACSGNHDDWSHGPVDPVWALMRRHGVVYRKGAVRLALNFGGRQVSVAIRHKWQGRSMYSPAHWLMRATMAGWWDHLMIGGHTHIDEDRSTIRSSDGFIAHGCQLSSFKEFDKYADVEGFSGQRLSPVRYCVINPSLGDSDHELVTVRYTYDRAMADLDALSGSVRDCGRNG